MLKTIMLATTLLLAGGVSADANAVELAARLAGYKATQCIWAASMEDMAQAMGHDRKPLSAECQEHERARLAQEQATQEQKQAAREIAKARDAEVEEAERVNQTFISANRPKRYPSLPSQYKRIVREYMHTTLVDPWSAHYERWQTTTYDRIVVKSHPNQFDGKCKQFNFSIDHKCMPDLVTAVEPMTKVVVDINAKNRMGGYVGWTQYACLFNKSGLVGCFED